MKILLHICCAPCAVYPLEILSASGHQVRGFFYNPNIHPYQEFARRMATLEDYAAKTRPAHDLGPQLSPGRIFARPRLPGDRSAAGSVTTCGLTATARVAQGGKFDAFTSTLLYSKFQNHELIRELAPVGGPGGGGAFLLRGLSPGVGRRHGHDQEAGAL